MKPDHANAAIQSGVVASDAGLAVKKVKIIIVLAVAAAIGSLFQVPLYQSISLLFGPVFALIAARMFGVGPAMLVAAAGSIVTFVAWGHPWAAFALIFEAGFVALMLRRMDNLVVAVAIYWLMIGFWAILASYTLLLGLPWESASFIALKQAINGVLNAVLAGLALAAMRVGIPSVRALIPRTTIHALVFYLVTLATIVSVTVMIVGGSRSQYGFAERQLEAAMDVVTSWTLHEIDTAGVFESQHDALEAALAGLRLTDGRSTISLDDFHVAVTNRDGVSDTIRGVMRSNNGDGSITSVNGSVELWQPDGDMPAMARSRQSYYILERQFPDHPEIASITVEFHAAPIIASLEQRARWDMILLGLTTTLTLFLTYVILHWLIAPLTRLAELSKGLDDAVQSGTSVNWLPDTGVKEYDTLSSTLDTASRALVVGFEERKALAELLETRVQERAAQLDFLSQIVQQTNNAVVVTDVAGRITWANEAFTQLSGYGMDMLKGQVPGSLLQKVSPAAQVREQMQTGLARGQGFAVELLNHRRDGTPYWVEIRCSALHDQQGRHTGFIAIQNDVTMRHDMEDRLRQSQKLEAVGHLTGGLAHDFNNLLTVIIGCGDMLGAALDDRPDLRQLVDMSVSAAESGSRLTRSLLAFARRQPLEPTNAALDKLTLNFLPLLRQSVGEKVRVAALVSEKTWPVWIDVSQYESALLNLAVNGRDAMPEGGALSIHLTNVQIDETQIVDGDDASPGRYLCIDVADTGKGISPEVLQHVFEPFYTTKRDQSRSGLGLSMVFGFVAQSGGFVRITSEVGKGTRVRMFFPAVADQGKPSDVAARPVIGAAL